MSITLVLCILPQVSIPIELTVTDIDVRMWMEVHLLHCTVRFIYLTLISLGR